MGGRSQSSAQDNNFTLTLLTCNADAQGCDLLTRSSDILLYITYMYLAVNPADELPIYRQIMRQIVEAIAGGRLQPGERLLSHRELSEQLVIAPLTVKKAYDELEALGYIESQRGRGTFVAARLPKMMSTMRTAQLTTSARNLLSQAYLAGLNYADVVRILKEADREIAEGPAQPHRKAQ